MTLSQRPVLHETPSPSVPRPEIPRLPVTQCCRSGLQSLYANWLSASPVPGPGPAPLPISPDRGGGGRGMQGGRVAVSLGGRGTLYSRGGGGPPRATHSSDSLVIFTRGSLA